MSWSEDRIHRWLLALPRPRGLAGSRGHDAAVLERLDDRPVVCVDQTVESVHFAAGTDPRLVGRKAAARALSDLAATAAEPRGLLLALTAPASRSEAWMKAVIAAVRTTGRDHGAELFGGDLCSARGPAHLTVSAVGTFRGRGEPPGRDRARPGQVVVITGSVGGSSRGRHLTFTPRIAEGRRLHARGATAMMDVSDGLAWDLHRLARASGVRIDLDLERVPVHADARVASKRSGRPAIWHALHDGEDHELVATIEPGDLGRSRHAVIGLVNAGSGLWLRNEQGRTRLWRPSEGGWKHGG